MKTATAATEATPTFDPSAPPSLKAIDLELALLTPSKTNPRQHYDQAELDQLTTSVRAKGVLMAILVRPLPGGFPFDFEIVAGERRYRAAKAAGLQTIPAIVRQLTDTDVLEIQLEENLHRKDLTDLEEARGIKRLIDAAPEKYSNITTAVSLIATKIGKSEGYVWDTLKLLDLVPDAQQLLEDKRITRGHAILISRLKPDHQLRVIAADSALRGVRHNREETGGLWQAEHGTLDYGDDDGEAHEAYDGLKPVSVRELERYIQHHIRFDPAHAAQAQPFQFEATAAQVAEAQAQPGRGKKVIAITHEYRVADDARDESERTFGSESWKRADGQAKSKTCEHSVLGVVVAGPGQGTTLQVCVAGDRCRVHFDDRIKAREANQKLRAQGKGQQAATNEQQTATASRNKYAREEAERKGREQAWEQIAAAVVGDAVAQVKGVKALTARQAAALEKQGTELGFEEIRKHLGAKWFTVPAAALLVSAVTCFHFRTWNTKDDGFTQFVRDVAKPFGLNVKRLEAVRDKHAPKLEPEEKVLRGGKLKRQAGQKRVDQLREEIKTGAKKKAGTKR